MKLNNCITEIKMFAKVIARLCFLHIGSLNIQNRIADNPNRRIILA